MKIYKVYGKRAFDLLFSFIGISLLSPVFLLLAIILKRDSKGPVFFAQKRMGLKGKPFLLIKFRTMHADQTKEKLGHEPGANNRITPFGSILRKTKIDELPEIMNVLKGDMSFVGPRPEVSKYENFYRGDYGKILTVRPGITDKASIKYRNEEILLSQQEQPEKFYNEVILPDKLKMNLEYVENGPSFKCDMNIIMETVKQILFG